MGGGFDLFFSFSLAHVVCYSCSGLLLPYAVGFVPCRVYANHFVQMFKIPSSHPLHSIVEYCTYCSQLIVLSQSIRDFFSLFNSLNPSPYRQGLPCCARWDNSFLKKVNLRIFEKDEAHSAAYVLTPPPFPSFFSSSSPFYSNVSCFASLFEFSALTASFFYFFLVPLHISLIYTGKAPARFQSFLVRISP